MATKPIIRYRNRPKKKSRRRAKTVLPLAVVGGLAAGVAEPLQYAASGRFTDGMRQLSKNYSGYDPIGKYWSVKDLKAGLIPLMIGVMIHKVAGKMGVNRAIARSGIPFVRI